MATNVAAMRLSRLGPLGALLLVGVAVSPGEAQASGYSVARFGGEHGHPTATNPTTLYYNPAGYGMSDGTHVFVDVNLAWRKVTWDHARSPSDDASAPAGANDGQGKIFNILASPMLGVSHKIGDLALAAGFFTPFGGQSSWSKNDEFKDDPNFPGVEDGPQRWHAISGRITSSFISLGGAYHLKDTGLSLGLSGNLILSNISTLRGKTISSDNALGQEGRSFLDAKGTDWSLGFGALYEAMKNELWLGASYQSRPNFSGMKPLKGELKTFLPGSAESTQQVEVDTDLPDVYRAGVRYRPRSDMELRLFGDYTRWSVLERHCVYREGESCEIVDEGTGETTNNVQINQPRRWHDTFGVRVGASMWTSKTVEIFTGMGFSSNAVPDETLEPALPDFDGFSFSVGGRFGLTDSVSLATSYTQLIYVPRDTTGKSELPSKLPLTKGVDGGGGYEQAVGVLNANVELVF